MSEMETSAERNQLSTESSGSSVDAVESLASINNRLDILYTSNGVSHLDNRIGFIYYCRFQVLENILMMIEDPEDLLNCVMSVSAYSIMDSLPTHTQKTSTYVYLTLPHLMKYLDKIDLLRCSEVSPSWMKAVDSAVQDMENDLCWLQDVDGQYYDYFDWFDCFDSLDVF